MLTSLLLQRVSYYMVYGIWFSYSQHLAIYYMTLFCVRKPCILPLIGTEEHSLIVFSFTWNEGVSLNGYHALFNNLLVLDIWVISNFFTNLKTSMMSSRTYLGTPSRHRPRSGLADQRCAHVWAFGRGGLLWALGARLPSLMLWERVPSWTLPSEPILSF